MVTIIGGGSSSSSSSSSSSGRGADEGFERSNCVMMLMVLMWVCNVVMYVYVVISPLPSTK